MFRTLISVLALTSAIMFAPINTNVDARENSVVVTIDRAKVVRIPRPAGTVIIGNPSIVDAVVQDDVTLVLTGKSFGVTNMIVLDHSGNPIVDETVVVKVHEENTVRIYRMSDRSTMACAPVCEPTLTIGDDNRAFNAAQEQVTQRNALSQPTN